MVPQYLYNTPTTRIPFNRLPQREESCTALPPPEAHACLLPWMDSSTKRRPGP